MDHLPEVNGSGGTNRMAQGNGPTCWIHPGVEAVVAKLICKLEQWGGESLVGLNDVHILDGLAGPLEGFPRGRDWRQEHGHRLATGHGAGHNFTEGLNAQRFSLVRTHEQDRRRSIYDLRG